MITKEAISAHVTHISKTVLSQASQPIHHLQKPTQCNALPTVVSVVVSNSGSHKLPRLS